MDCCRKSCVIHDANIEIFLFVTIFITFNLFVIFKFILWSKIINYQKGIYSLFPY